MKLEYVLILLTVLININSFKVQAQNSDSPEWGIRAGATINDNVEDFIQVDVFGIYRLPWQWNWDSDWTLGTRLNASVGILTGGDDTGAVVTLGPGLELAAPGGRLRFTFGVSPTYISEDKYGKEDLGGNFHFTSYLGVNYQITDYWTLGYRFHHMSNADIEVPNPGLDIHSISLSYRRN
jgi:hypothetical protein